MRSFEITFLWRGVSETSHVSLVGGGYKWEFDTRPFYRQPEPSLKKLGVKVTKPHTDVAYW